MFTQDANVVDVVVADALRLRMSALVFAYGGEIPDGDLFGTIALDNGDYITKRFGDNVQDGDDVTNAIAGVCREFSAKATGIGLAMRNGEITDCACYDNFMNANASWLLGFDNEGLPDVQIVKCRVSDMDALTHACSRTLWDLKAQGLADIAGSE